MDDEIIGIVKLRSADGALIDLWMCLDHVPGHGNRTIKGLMAFGALI